MTARTDGPSAAVRIRVLKRDKFTCTYCGTCGSEAELEIDHIHAVAKGGSHHVSNLTTACRACNQKKGSGGLSIITGKKMNANIALPVGMFLHTLIDGDINYQGHVIGSDGDTLFVQLFSFLDGGSTIVVTMSKAEVYDKGKCILYSNEEDWNIGYVKHEAKRKRSLSIVST